MDRTQIMEIARSKKVNPEVFADFIEKRFPGENCPSYITTWAERFSEGVPQIYMDNASKAVFNEVISSR